MPTHFLSKSLMCASPTVGNMADTLCIACSEFMFCSASESSAKMLDPRRNDEDLCDIGEPLPPPTPLPMKPPRDSSSCRRCNGRGEA